LVELDRLEFVDSKKKEVDDKMKTVASLFGPQDQEGMEEPKSAPFFAKLDWDKEDDKVGQGAAVHK